MRCLCGFVLAALSTVLYAVEGPLPPQAAVPQLNTQTHWIGNTWGGGIGPKAQFFQGFIDDIAVAGERMYAIAPWDEHGSEGGIYNTAGDKLTIPEAEGDWNAQFHSWGFSGGKAVAVSADYVFYGMTQNGAANPKKKYSGVARYTRDGKAAGWKGAVANHRFIINDDNKALPLGLAVRDDELFITDSVGQRIVVVGIADMIQRRELAIPDAGRLLCDATAEKGLWVINRSTKQVVRYDAQGKLLGQAITDCLLPVALAIDPRQGDLLVADAAPERQCVRRYSAGTWKHQGPDLGTPIWSGSTPGMVGPARFYDLRGIACDELGNLYVAEYAFGAKLHKFDATGKEVWVRKGLEFVNCADVDPGDENALYSTSHRYYIDLTKAPGQSWREVSLTVDPLRYPQDPRLVGSAALAMRMFRVDGQRIMVGRPQQGGTMLFWRFDGDIAVPAAGWWPEGIRGGAFPPQAPAKGAFMWVDLNGNGAYEPEEYTEVPQAAHHGKSANIDSALGLSYNRESWAPGKGTISRIPFAKLTKQGVPTWDLAALTTQKIPADTGITAVAKLTYDPTHDRMYLGCFTPAHPQPSRGWEQMNTGLVLQRFDGWSTATPTLAWESLLAPPEGMVNKLPSAWSLEKDHLFVASTWKHDQLAVDVWRLADGVRVGRLLPTPDIGGVTGWIDMMDAVQSHQRKDGSYLICVEEVWMAKGLFWHWQPPK